MRLFRKDASWSLFNRATTTEAVHTNAPTLSDPHDPVTRLRIRRRIPPFVYENDVICFGKS